MTRRSLIAAPAALLGAAGGLSRPRAFPVLPAAEVFGELDLTRPELHEVAEAWRRGQLEQALDHLLDYFRRRPPILPADPGSPSAAHRKDAQACADRLLGERLLDLGLGYPPQPYSYPIDWDADPVGDIEWRAALHRFSWQDCLLEAFAASGRDEYAAGWVRLAEDWIQSHPLADPDRFEWLDIQVGIRAARWCTAFEQLKSSPAFTAEFLLRFLASVHAHARKSYLYPRRSAHNKAAIEAEGLLRVALVFGEFREASRWLARALELLNTTVEEQLSTEGVQREWTPSYHCLVAGLSVDAMALTLRGARPFPNRLRRRIQQMFDVWVAMTAPDGSLPMFGDTQRSGPVIGTPEHLLAPMARAAAWSGWRSTAAPSMSSAKLVTIATGRLRAPQTTRSVKGALRRRHAGLGCATKTAGTGRLRSGCPHRREPSRPARESDRRR